jgi:hypothetical protein
MQGLVIAGGDSGRPVVLRDMTQTRVIRSGIQGPMGPVGPDGATGPAGSSFQLAGSAASYADLPTTLVAADAGQAWMTNDDGRVYVWSGTAWPASGSAPVLQGPAGADGAPGQIRFTGHGAPPGVIVGANPGDTYLDLDSGDVFKLV